MGTGTGRGLAGRLGVLSVVGVVASLYSLPTSAHFHLDAPEAALTQLTNGDPQKPANNTDMCPAGPASNKVTQAKAGQKLTVKITETILHPGHYRISFADNKTKFSLPATTPANNICPATTAISNPPVLPIIADNVFPHTAGNFCNGTNTCQTDVTLPNVAPGMYILQVMEWMSTPHASAGNNGAYGCFYIHCATVQIVDPDASIPDGGAITVDGGSSDSGVDPDDDDDAGGTGGGSSSGSEPSGNRFRSTSSDDGCSVGWGGASGVSLLASVGLGIIAIARRRRRSK